MFLGSIHRGKKQNLIPSASTPMLSVSPRGRRPRTKVPSLHDQGTPYSRTPPLSCSPTVRHFPTARQAWESTSPSLAPTRLNRPTRIGAMQPTSSTGELSAIFHALAWIRMRRKSVQSSLGQRLLCKPLFATRSIKPVANKRLIAQIYVLLDQVKRDNDISISWTPEHTVAGNPPWPEVTHRGWFLTKACVV